MARKPYVIYMHPTTNRFYFKLYDASDRLIGTYGQHFGWPTRDDAISAALDQLAA
jgi:hypothetical protein